MSAKIINGKELSEKIKNEIRNELAELKKDGVIPGLAVIIVGDDPASRIYVDLKKRDCEEVGIASYEYALPKETEEKELLTLIEKLNKDKRINGILVQCPLPSQINQDKVINAISPEKDVDAFHPINVGKMVAGNPQFLPCTPAGVMEMIKSCGIEVEGKECVVVGRSNIVGKPQAILLLSQNGTVTICHSKTKNLEEVCRRADILVAAVGKPKIIKGSFIKPGSVVIDVGTNRYHNNKLVGDVDFEEASKIAYAISPVPGGVGPMTRVMLLKNTVKAFALQASM